MEGQCRLTILQITLVVCILQATVQGVSVKLKVVSVGKNCTAKNERLVSMTATLTTTANDSRLPTKIEEAGPRNDEGRLKGELDRTHQCKDNVCKFEMTMKETADIYCQYLGQNGRVLVNCKDTNGDNAKICVPIKPCPNAPTPGPTKTCTTAGPTTPSTSTGPTTAGTATVPNRLSVVFFIVGAFILMGVLA